MLLKYLNRIFFPVTWYLQRVSDPDRAWTESEKPMINICICTVALISVTVLLVLILTSVCCDSVMASKYRNLLLDDEDNSFSLPGNAVNKEK